MDWEMITKVAVAAAGLLGLGLGWINWRTAHSLSVHKLGETELGALLAEIERQERDPVYGGFLQNLRKEKLASMAFGCPVPLREIGRLMVYYECGFATTEQIRMAWPHRNSYERPLSFALRRSAKIQLGVAMVYVALCLLAGTLLAFLALVPPWRVSSASAGGTATCFFAFGYLALRIHRSLLVASELSGREGKEREAGDTR